MNQHLVGVFSPGRSRHECSAWCRPPRYHVYRVWVLEDLLVDGNLTTGQQAALETTMRVVRHAQQAEVIGRAELPPRDDPPLGRRLAFAVRVDYGEGGLPSSEDIRPS